MGNVAVANARGSGLVEAATPAAFLPHLCRHIMGEELKMPTFATWWCGQQQPLSWIRCAAWAAPSFPAGRPLLEAAIDLCHRIFTDFKYGPRAITITTPIDQILQKRNGMCQDFALVMIACERSRGACPLSRPQRTAVRQRASVACVGVGILPGFRRARFRSDQRRHAGGQARNDRVGSRPLRRAAGQGRRVGQR